MHSTSVKVNTALKEMLVGTIYQSSKVKCAVDLDSDWLIKMKNTKFIPDEKMQPVVNPYYWPAVTRILIATQTQKEILFLENWQAKQINEYGFYEFEKRSKQNKTRGVEFHNWIENYLRAGSQERKSLLKLISSLSSHTQAYIASIMSVLDCFGKIIGIEENVAHPVLHYIGRYDIAAKFKRKDCMIDFKTVGIDSSKNKYKQLNVEDCYQDPIQVAAYGGAYNAIAEKPLKSGYIIYVREDGEHAMPVYLAPKRMIENFHVFRNKNVLRFWQRMYAANEQEDFVNVRDP